MRLRFQATAFASSALLLAKSTHVISGFHIHNSPPINSNNNRRLAKPFCSFARTTKLSGGASTKDISNNPNGGTATIPDEIFNLVKSIIGAGVLSLPAGIAAFGNAPSAILPSTLLIALMGLISGYTFSLLARICRLSGATSYADAWEKTRGKQTAWIVAASSALDCFAGNLSYSMILADAVKDLLAAVGIVTTRSNALLGLSGLVLMPLCLIKNLSTLAPFSLIGIMGVAYTSVAIGVRYFGGAYAMPSGRFVADLAPHLRPSFGSMGAMRAFSSPKSLILVSVLSTAYIAHFNAPKFYRELKNNTQERFNTVVASSFGISIAVYAAVSSMAFLTFGGASAGLILNNYSTQDVLLSLSRFAVALSLVFSYPLLFVGLRDGVLDLLQIPESRRSHSLLNQWSVGVVAVITGLALKVTDLTFVASMSGAVLGTSLIFIFPTLMFRAAVRDDPSKKRERRLCSVIASVGVAVGGVGAKMAMGSL